MLLTPQETQLNEQRAATPLWKQSDCRQKRMISADASSYDVWLLPTGEVGGSMYALRQIVCVNVLKIDLKEI